MSDFVKLALNPAVVAGMTRSLKGLGAGMGMGGAVGGLGGAAVGAVKGYRDARADGGGTADAIKGGLLGAGQGAAKGVLLGAAAGGAAGAARPALAESAARSPMLRGASNFGQRQVHALTGVGDTAYLRSIGGGAHDAQKRLEAAGSAAFKPGWLREYNQAQRAYDASSASERAGLYSIPGYAKALAQRPLETLRTGVRDQWENLGTGGRALMYGLPAAGVASELANGSVEGAHGSEPGMGRFERAARVAGAAGSGMLAPLAIGGDVALGGALTSGFGRLGRLADQRFKRPAPAANAPNTDGGSTQSEAREFSDRAAGVVPEGFTQ